MAVITLKQLLHRPSPGAAIGPSSPLEVRQYGGDGQPLSPATAAGQTATQQKIETLAQLVGALNTAKETNPDAASASALALLRGLIAVAGKETTLGAIKSAVEALADLISNGVLKTALTGHLPTLTTVHHQDTTANGVGQAASVQGYSTIAFQVTGTFDAFVHFEGTVDGVTWVPIEAVSPLRYATPITDSAGVYVADIRGFSQVRARISGYVSGSVTVVSVASTVGGGIERPRGLYRSWATAHLMTSATTTRWFGENGVMTGGAIPAGLVPFTIDGQGSVVITIRNTHDVSIRYSVYLTNRGYGLTYGGVSAVAELQTLASGATAVLDSSSHADLGKLRGGIVIALLRNASGTVPASGSVSVDIVGRPV